MDQQTKWNTPVSLCHVDQDDVIGAVQKKVVRDPLSSSMAAGNRFAEKQYYGDAPVRLPRFQPPAFCSEFNACYCF